MRVVGSPGLRASNTLRMGVWVSRWRLPQGILHSQDEVERRANGRRHYNSVRQCRATLRQMEVVRLLAQGVRRRVVIAQRLSVHPSTMSRDVQAILALRPGACPTCGRGFALAWADDPSPFAP